MFSDVSEWVFGMVELELTYQRDVTVVTFHICPS
jgi:hypothetical protein